MSDPKKSETTSWDARKVRQESGKSERTHHKKQRNKAQQKNMKVAIYIASVVVASTLLAGIAWLMVSDVCALNKEPLTVTIEVEKGESVGKVATKLKKAGLVESKTLFLIFGSVFDAKETIGPGTYELNSDMDFRCLINSMNPSNSLIPEGVVRVTIPEGYTVQETIALLAAEGVSTEEALTEAAKNYVFEGYDFINNEQLGDITRLEGYLAPDTYEFFEDEDPEKALGRLLDNFNGWMDESVRADIEKSGHSFHDIVVMASLIEKEAIGDDEERANIGSVLYNRLANPSRETAGYLQLDSTIYYILRTNGMEDTEFSTDIDSPYNTYRYQGLPAGPICNPSRSSLLAATYPSNTDYYYFAYGKDGVSHFFTNYDDHLAFVNSDMYQPD